MIGPDDVCLSINDGTLIALIAARLGAKHVYAIELERMCNMMLKKYVQENNLQDKVTVLDKKTDELSLIDLGGTQVRYFKIHLRIYVPVRVEVVNMFGSTILESLNI